MSEIIVDISVAQEVVGELESDNLFTADLGGSAIVFPPYDGDTEITPNDGAQVLQTAGKYFTGNITINRIPQTEYAHITYDQNQDIRVW